MTVVISASIILCIVGILCDVVYLNTNTIYLHHISQICILGGQIGILMYLLKHKEKDKSTDIEDRNSEQE